MERRWGTWFGLALLAACGGGSDATGGLDDAGDGSVDDAISSDARDDAPAADADDAASSADALEAGDAADAADAPATDSWSDAPGASDAPDAPPIDAGPPLPVSVASVASGDEHTCRIRAGQLWCWGLNRYGEVGTGDTTPAPTPTRIGVDADWQFVAAGGQRACAIKSSGKLYCWGGNASAPTPPTQVGTASDWAMVSVGGDTTCALRAGHTLWCWASSGAPTPAQIGTDASWSFVSAGQHHRCALKADGSAWCWGTDFFGQLGDGGGADQSAPVRAFTGTYSHIVAASDYTCGSVGGSLYCWGFIGNKTPSLVGSGADPWTQLSGPSWNVCGIRGGAMWCLGKNAHGELGDPNVTNPSGVSGTLKQVGLDVDWTDVSVGYEHACGFHAGGALTCWGSRGAFQLGDGLGPSFVPKSIDASSVYTAVDVGSATACGRRSDGSLLCWGDNEYGEAGIPSAGAYAAPTRVGALTTWLAPNLGGHTSCAPRSDGTLWCWGYDRTAQVGDGTTTNRSAPVQVLATPPALPATDWLDVATGTNHTCGLRAMGAPAAPSVSCWGAAALGQLGNGPATGNQSYPVAVAPFGTGGIVSLSAGTDATCARLGDGTLRCWGTNANGQIGTGATTASYSTPTAVDAATDWNVVSVGGGFACATKSSGSLWCWGSNSNGQLGDGGTTAKRAPGRVGSDTDWQSVSAGSFHACAIKSDKSLWCWGASSMGQLGDGTVVGHGAPARVGTGNDWLSVTAGNAFTCGRRGTGTLACWGANDAGQLGDGNGWTATPIVVP